MKFDKVDKIVQGLDEVVIPRMMKVRQVFNSDTVEDVEQVLKDQLLSTIDEETISNLKDKSIAISAGSRGIPSYKEILKTIVVQLQEWGAQPFVFPAMGSHAGGTAESQREYLKQFGITEEYLGIPIKSSMEAVEIGRLDDGLPIYCDKYAFEADGIVVFHKIKPHTHFKGDHESGLLKMISIGIGKHLGAATFHKYGFDDFDKHLVEVSQEFINKMNVVFGVGLIQNAYDMIGKIEVIPTDKIIEKDAELLRLAIKNMPKLKLDDIDVLIIDEIGKDISGFGFDPNITGRIEVVSQQAKFKEIAPDIKKIILLDISDNSHGNGIGCGEADLVTLRFVNKLDLSSTYTNIITNKYLKGVAIPLYGNSDLDAIKLGIITSMCKDMDNPKIIRIKNTLELEYIEVSEAYIEDINNRDDLLIESELYSWAFNEDENLW